MTIPNKVSIAIIVLFSALTAHSQNTAVTWSSFNLGFAATASATTNAQSVAGQLVVGSAQSSSTRIESGFTPGASGPPPITATFTITTVSDTGEGSLRWAMQTSNATAGLNLITFNIPGSGVHTITPASPLPSFTDPVIIDGYTQPGASPNTNPPELGSNAVLLIELNGINTGGAGCLELETTGSTVRGLVINRAPIGIYLLRAGNSVIEGNFIGTNPSGTAALGNGVGIGIDLNSNSDRIGGTSPAARNVISGNLNGGIVFGAWVESGGSNHVIEGNLIGTNAAGTGSLGNGLGVAFSYGTNNVLVGGTIPAARNVISGNGTGVSFSSGLGSPLVSHNLVQGNFIGTDVTGTVAVGNTMNGISIYGLNNTVGGSTSGARNIISGNGGNGIDIFAGSGSVVEGNYIGTDVNGTSPLGNQYIGVSVTAHDVKVGGTEPGAGNIIAFNGTTPSRSAGVAIVANSTRNAILGNSIFSNAGLGIDLGGTYFPYPDGVTPNDSCDGDTLGPNNYQNYPVLSSALPSGGNTIVQGTLNSVPNNIFRIEFFSSPTPDSTGYGEGKTFLGFTTVITDNNCLAAFVDTLMSPVPLNLYIAATATDTGSNTSEFSRSLAVGTTSVQHSGIEMPTRYALEQNYPNPFNPVTVIRYQLPITSYVTLTICNVLGQEVAVLVDGIEDAGHKSVEWSAGNRASGVFFYRLQAGEFIETKKLLLLK